MKDKIEQTIAELIVLSVPAMAYVLGSYIISLL